MMVLSSVVLPVPLRPSRARHLLWPRTKLTSLTMIAPPYPARNRSIRRSSPMMAGASQVDGLDARIVGDFVGAAFYQQGTVDEHRHAGGEAEDQVHVVLDQQHRDI